MPESTQTILGFDFGEKRIGVAVGNTLAPIATPLTTIVVSSTVQKFSDINKLIQEWQPSILVVGLPCFQDGTPHEMTIQAQRFARQLHGRFGLPVALVDERYTSAIAERALYETGAKKKKRRKETIDCLAAQLILQSYLDGADHENRFQHTIT